MKFTWEITVHEKYNFHWQTSKFIEGHGFNILIQKYFLQEWEQIYQFSLKSKTMEGNSAATSFLVFHLNQIFNQFLFLHFLGLWTLYSLTWRVLSSIIIFFNLTFISLWVYEFILSQELKRHDRLHTRLYNNRII